MYGLFGSPRNLAALEMNDRDVTDSSVCAGSRAASSARSIEMFATHDHLQPRAGPRAPPGNAPAAPRYYVRRNRR